MHSVVLTICDADLGLIKKIPTYVHLAV
jgi:hypothetical protein